MQKETKFKGGFSEAAWKSLVVKSIRLGWPEGLRQAQKRLTPSVVKSVLFTNLFEDTFPAIQELNDCLEEVKRLDYEALCARETHHGRHHTEKFCGIKEDAMDMAKNHREEVYMLAKPYGLFLPPRALNVFWTWVQIRPIDAEVKRSLDMSPWRGMPDHVLDVHTYEGKVMKRPETLTSGFYRCHAKLAELVHAHGWDHVRQLANNYPVLPVQDEPVLPVQAALL